MFLRESVSFGWRMYSQEGKGFVVFTVKHLVIPQRETETVTVSSHHPSNFERSDPDFVIHAQFLAPLMKL